DDRPQYCAQTRRHAGSAQCAGRRSGMHIDATGRWLGIKLRLTNEGTAMTYLDVSRIASWHAHVYFDATSRDAAREFRDVVNAEFGDRVQMGRFHEREL